MAFAMRFTQQLFLSTPSARRATKFKQKKTQSLTISIHALREEGDDCVQVDAGRTIIISIHALREEGDDFSSSWL